MLARRAAGLMLLISSLCLAWTPKEYALLSRQAAADVAADPLSPAAFKAWIASIEPADPASAEAFFMNVHVGPFAKGLSGLSYWAVEPDLVAATDAGRTVLIEPFGLPERALHYLDLEQLHLRPERRLFSPTLAHKPTFAEVPRAVHDPRYARAGMLPFRAEQCYQNLIDALVEGRLQEPPQPPFHQHAAKWAGYLAHYLADGWEPPHATVDYRFNWVFPGDAVAQAAVIEAFGVRLCDNPAEQPTGLRQQYWQSLQAARQELRGRGGDRGGGLPIQSKDTWEASVEALRYSYDFLPHIGAAARAAYQPPAQTIDLATFYDHRDPKSGRTLLEARASLQAMAILQIRQQWQRAWEDARNLREALTRPNP
jgi:hypothetical protein